MYLPTTKTFALPAEKMYVGLHAIVFFALSNLTVQRALSWAHTVRTADLSVSLLATVVLTPSRSCDLQVPDRQRSVYPNGSNERLSCSPFFLNFAFSHCCVAEKKTLFLSEQQQQHYRHCFSNFLPNWFLPPSWWSFLLQVLPQLYSHHGRFPVGASSRAMLSAHGLRGSNWSGCGV